MCWQTVTLDKNNARKSMWSITDFDWDDFVFTRCCFNYYYHYSIAISLEI